MTAPVPPPMLHYIVHFDDGAYVDIVTCARLRFEELPAWLEVYKYHPNVHQYYWNTELAKVWIRTKSIQYVSFVEYIKPPLGKVKE